MPAEVTSEAHSTKIVNKYQDIKHYKDLKVI